MVTGPACPHHSRPEHPCRTRGDCQIDPRRLVAGAVSTHAQVGSARKHSAGAHLRWLAHLVFALLVQAGGNRVQAEDTTVNSATALRVKYAELRGNLEVNPFQKPLYLESTEASGELKGSIFTATIRLRLSCHAW